MIVKIGGKQVMEIKPAKEAAQTNGQKKWVTSSLVSAAAAIATSTPAYAASSAMTKAGRFFEHVQDYAIIGGSIALIIGSVIFFFKKSKGLKVLTATGAIVGVTFVAFPALMLLGVGGILASRWLMGIYETVHTSGGF